MLDNNFIIIATDSQDSSPNLLFSLLLNINIFSRIITVISISYTD